MRKSLTLAILILMSLLALVLLGGCRTNMSPYEAGSAGNPRKVLIAGEASEFKQAVVKRVIETLGTDLWYFRIVGLDQLAGASKPNRVEMRAEELVTLLEERI